MTSSESPTAAAVIFFHAFPDVGKESVASFLNILLFFPDSF